MQARQSAAPPGNQRQSAEPDVADARDSGHRLVMDAETKRRAREGIEPDLIGWHAIASELGLSERQARAWGTAGLPLVSWGPKQVAAYTDRIRAWAMTRRLNAMDMELA